MWDNFNRITCINLSTRRDRLDYAKSQFDRVGLSGKVEYTINPPSPNGGCYGCFESHWSIIKQAFDDGLDNVLIFEDDVTFGEGWESVVRDCAQFVKHEEDWDFLNVCGHIYFYVEDSKTSSNIINGKSTKTHAICLSRQGMETFLDHYPQPESVGVDDAYLCLLSKTFTHRNYQAIYQDEFLGTDNPWVFFDDVDEKYATYIQNVFIPKISVKLSYLNLLFGRLPYFLRPWLIANTFSENLSSDIAIWRNGRPETIAWKVNFFSQLLVSLVGIYTVVTINTPEKISRFKMLRALVKMG